MFKLNIKFLTIINRYSILYTYIMIKPFLFINHKTNVIMCIKLYLVHAQLVIVVHWHRSLLRQSVMTATLHYEL